MFIEKQTQKRISYYERLLKALGSISGLFSDSPEPYLASRATENLFCKAFDAKNLSRSDASADASKDNIGIGIKTFLEKNGQTMQKIAEFNSEHNMFSALSPEKKIRKIAKLRNERIDATKRIYKLDELIYHCLTRKAGKILVYETPADLIQIKKIKGLKVAARGSSIQFRDSLAEYNFSVSKSTLFKRFITPRKVIMEIPVRILSDPFDELEKLISSGLIFAPIKVQPHVFLPLYSKKKGIKQVPEKSGLNQWNASGRPRDPNEIYIPIPAWIHRKFPTFFPKRDKVFELTLPDRNMMSAKVCQVNSKALMSNPNSALGKWLLRDILNLKDRELLTYEKLEEIGLDTVVIYKIDGGHYDIDFSRIGSYEGFEVENGENGKAETEALQGQDDE